MPKKRPKGKIKLIPEKPREVMRKLERNGFKLENKDGGDFIYSKVKDGERKVVIVSVHPKELGKHYIKMVIRRANKTNEEWVSL